MPSDGHGGEVVHDNPNEEILEGDDTKFEDITLRVNSPEGYASIRTGIIDTHLNIGSEGNRNATVVGPNGYNVRLGIRADDDEGTVAMTSNLSPAAARRVAAELEKWADKEEKHREESEYFDEGAGKRAKDVDGDDREKNDEKDSLLRRLMP